MLLEAGFIAQNHYVLLIFYWVEIDKQERREKRKKGGMQKKKQNTFFLRNVFFCAGMVGVSSRRDEGETKKQVEAISRNSNKK